MLGGAFQLADIDRIWCATRGYNVGRYSKLTEFVSDFIVEHLRLRPAVKRWIKLLSCKVKRWVGFAQFLTGDAACAGIDLHLCQHLLQPSGRTKRVSTPDCLS